MFRTVVRTMFVTALALGAVLSSSPHNAAAAGTTGLVADTGVAACWGAYRTGDARFVSIRRPAAYAFNQHPGSVDQQRLQSRALLYRWNGSSWQPVYTSSGVPVQTPWKSELVSDGQDNVLQISGSTTYLGQIDITRDGYYAILFDLRWDATNTVTTSGSRLIWATPMEENGADWLGPHDYCTYIPQEITIDIGG